MSNIFVVSDPAELVALQRVFREAKFCKEPDDIEVSDSPVVAQLFQRLVAILIEKDVERDGEDARLRWAQWLAIDESRDEWDAAVQRANAEARWATFSPDERFEYLKILLSPFTVTQEVVERFVSAVSHQRK